MKLEAVRIKNFRAFKDAEMTDIPSFCVLVGANGVGKSTFFSIFGFFLSTIYGGNAEIINGEYQIISHNNFVRYISKEEYNVLHFFERLSWTFVIYVLALLHILCLKYKDYNIVDMFYKQHIELLKV